MRQISFVMLTLAWGVAFTSIAPLSAFAERKAETVYAFHGGNDGAVPHNGLLRDKAGNVYGTTSGGGTYGFGTVFKIAPNGSETVLYSFHGGVDGQSSVGQLLADKNGNLYGTTLFGGVAFCFDYGCSGTAFKLTPSGVETVLHVFTGGLNDGANPYANLAMDKSGNLYGETNSGGSAGCSNNLGCGTIFKIAPNGVETLLHIFGSDGDGAYGGAGLIADKDGNMYGTTQGGGAYSSGTVFKLAPDGSETILHSFTGSDGAGPSASLLADRIGNLYGTTQFGGNHNCNCGSVFKIAPDGTETVLRLFRGKKDGANPVANLVADKKGNLYGTTYFGGDTGCFSQRGCGVAFEITHTGNEKILHRFTGVDGSNPDSSFAVDDAGYLYATTTQGATNNGGVVFKIKK